MVEDERYRTDVLTQISAIPLAGRTACRWMELPPLGGRLGRDGADRGAHRDHPDAA